MQKSKDYNRIIFTADHINEALRKWEELFLNSKDLKELSKIDLSIRKGSESWGYDSEEEIFADYRRGFTRANITQAGYIAKKICTFSCSVENGEYNIYTTVSVRALTRSEIESVFNVFEKNLPSATIITEPPPYKVPSPVPVIFIGHGRNLQWRDLKDHLHDKHGFEVEAYEIGARAGHSIRDILESMLRKSSFAILVMTGEDEDAEGKMHARENVIHEAGLFQGHLGFNKAIILLKKIQKNSQTFTAYSKFDFLKGI